MLKVRTDETGKRRGAMARQYRVTVRDNGVRRQRTVWALSHASAARMVAGRGINLTETGVINKGWLNFGYRFEEVV